MKEDHHDWRSAQKSLNHPEPLTTVIVCEDATNVKKSHRKTVKKPTSLLKSNGFWRCLTQLRFQGEAKRIHRKTDHSDMPGHECDVGTTHVWWGRGCHRGWCFAFFPEKIIWDTLPKAKLKMYISYLRKYGDFPMAMLVFWRVVILMTQGTHLNNHHPDE